MQLQTAEHLRSEFHSSFMKGIYKQSIQLLRNKEVLGDIKSDYFDPEHLPEMFGRNIHDAHLPLLDSYREAFEWDETISMTFKVELKETTLPPLGGFDEIGLKAILQSGNIKPYVQLARQDLDVQMTQVIPKITVKKLRLKEAN